jgi:hypothetical protein
LIKSFLFACAALIAVSLIGGLLNFLSKRSDQEKAFWLNSKKDQRYDFAFLGSSRVLNMVDIDYLESSWKMRGINMGGAGSGLADNYLILYRFYKNGNSASNLFIQIDEQSLDYEKGLGHPFHEYLFFDLLGDPAADDVYRQEVGKAKYLTWKYLPFLRYIEFNNPYKEMLLGFVRPKVDFELTRGSELLKKKAHESWSPAGMMKEWEVSPKSEAYLNMILDLARENGSHVILYTAPYPSDVNRNLATPAIDEYIIKLASKKKLVHLNFRQSTVSDRRDLFSNLSHLNEEGTAMFMAEFAAEAQRNLR